MMQTDLKKLVAYSSVSHLGFVMLGLFTLNLQGLQGSIYQMLMIKYIGSSMISQKT